VDELIERLRAFEGSDELGNGDFSLLSEAAAALEAAREDSERLDWLASEYIPEGLIHVESDIYDYAYEVAEENGRDEPTDADHLAGYRRMLDAARANDQGDSTMKTLASLPNDHKPPHTQKE
jgi:hypothetical protein